MYCVCAANRKARFACVVAALALAALFALPKPALAQSGGSGGFGYSGVGVGAGGTNTNPDGGTPASVIGGGAGGGGGGAPSIVTGAGGSGGSGGTGNSGIVIPAGDGGGGGNGGSFFLVNPFAIISGSGSDGGSGGDAPTASLGGRGGYGGGGGGGGAGGGGALITTSGNTLTSSATISGGSGGAGGAGGATDVYGYGGSAGNGGGGGTGMTITASGNSLTNNGSIAGAAGGNGGLGGWGGIQPGAGGNAGGGGAGIATTSNTTITNSGSITGGNGGRGGDVGDSVNNGGYSGDGGGGGAGILATASTITNSGSITGGNRGVAGSVPFNFGFAGRNGSGGVGIAGDNLTILNSGTITGGNGNNAIAFSGGSNILTTNGGTLTGSVNFNGATILTLNQTAAAGAAGSVDYSATNAFSGSGALFITTDANKSVTISGANTGFTGTTTVNAASTLALGNGTAIGHGNISLLAGSILGLNSATGTLSGTISGGGSVKQNDGIWTLTGANNYSGGTTLDAGTIVVGNNSALGTGLVSMAAGTNLSFASGTNFNLPNAIQISGDPTFTTPVGTTQTISGAIGDGALPGTVEVQGAGTLVLSAVNTYTGATNVDAGTLNVAGSIATSALTKVESGATITGTGTIGNLSVFTGGTFVPGAAGTPGTSTTVQGNLTFQTGAFYNVALNQSSTTTAQVSGTAALAGTVNATFAVGNYVWKQYRILTASGGLGGSTFASLATIGLPAGTNDSLSYDANNVYLNVIASNGYTGLNVNQQNVENALANSFNVNGGLPGQFFGLSAQNFTQISGESATAASKGATQLMNDFLGLMSDGDVSGGGAENAAATSAFAPEKVASWPPDLALAYVRALKQPPQSFDQRWSVWGSAFGGTGHVGGNATIGSNDVTSSDYGFAAGANYRATPNASYGFALAGGGTKWSLAQALGTGRSDAIQLGVYGKTHSGPLYLSAALAFANHWFNTSRVAIADDLQASFTGRSFGGRIEAGYRYALPVTNAVVGVTPYAAVQTAYFHTPGYSETDLTGGGFALTYNAMNATETRSELGARFDDLTMAGHMPLVLRGRLAWAHDWITNPAVAAVFQTIPNSNFTVNGAAPAKNAGLASGAAELHIDANWTVIAKVDGEFGSTARSYGGSGVVKYTW